MRVSDAITGRQSIRAFLSDKAVSDEQIEALLTVAARAPSGSNIQPWHVYVVRGESKDAITEACSARYLSGDEGAYEYHYYPRAWREPYLGRRRQTGFGLYGLLGVDRHDVAAVQGYRVQNYQFFGAPVGLFFTIDRDTEQGSWIDYGMFLQSFMLAAREMEMETCAQAAFCPYQDSVMPILAAPAEQMLVCGMSVGYADPAARVNSYRTDRLDAREFMTVLN